MPAAQTCDVPHRPKSPPRVPPKKTAEAIRAGARVREAREAAGLSLKMLSDKLGGKLDPSRISNYEQGLRELGIAEAEMLSAALDEPAAHLLGLVDNRQRKLLKLSKETQEALLSLHGAMSAESAGEAKEQPAGGKQYKISGDRPKDPSILPASLQRHGRA